MPMPSGDFVACGVYEQGAIAWIQEQEFPALNLHVGSNGRTTIGCQTCGEVTFLLGGDTEVVEPTTYKKIPKKKKQKEKKKLLVQGGVGNQSSYSYIYSGSDSAPTASRARSARASFLLAVRR
jgi:hypothetical protein